MRMENKGFAYCITKCLWKFTVLETKIPYDGNCYSRNETLQSAINRNFLFQQNAIQFIIVILILLERVRVQTWFLKFWIMCILQ